MSPSGALLLVMSEDASTDMAAEIERLEAKLAELEAERERKEKDLSAIKDKIDAELESCRKLESARDALEPKVAMETFLIVDNLPVMPADPKKTKKLKMYIGKSHFTKPEGVKLKSIQIVVDKEAKKTTGFAFLQYGDPKSCKLAADYNQNRWLDKQKKARMKTTVMSKFNDFDDVPAELPPVSERKATQLPPSINDWLLDENMRDQLLVRGGNDKTAVFWNDPYRCEDKDGRELVFESRGKWRENWALWSPKGSYVATTHGAGIQLWGGDNFELIGRFQHKGVRFVHFSPSEKYLITCNTRAGDPRGLLVWNIETGKATAFDCGIKQTWPIFKWSHDDEYFCRVAKDKIQVFETKTMGLLGRQAIPLRGVEEVQFSPHGPLIASWAPGKGSKPTSMHIFEVPSKRVARERHFYKVVNLRMQWHPQGDFLCVQLLLQKSKKTRVSSLELFRMRSKNIPTEVMQLPETIVDFKWEPRGCRFAMAYGMGDAPSKTDVSIYSLKTSKLKLLNTFEARQCNSIFWSPRGGSLVMAGLKDMSDTLEFIDVDLKRSLVKSAHLMCREVLWDPTGRYVITAVTQPPGEENDFRSSMENGYKLWTMQGQEIAKSTFKTLYQVMWRPRPDLILSTEEVKKIEQNLKQYQGRFQREDDEIRLSLMSGAQKRLREWRIEWQKYREKKNAERKAVLAEREQLGLLEPDDEMVEVDLVEETVLSNADEYVTL